MKINHLKAGIFTILPIVVFIWLLKWIINLMIEISNFLLIIPKKFYFHQETIDWYWNFIGFVSLLLFLWIVGYLVNHYYLGDKIRKITQPLIKKTPILNTLFRISKQAGDTLTNKKSFKEVVLVEFPVPGVYSVGFITGTTSKVFEDALCNETVTVFIPTTPNPTNGFLIVLEKNKVKKCL